MTLEAIMSVKILHKIEDNPYRLPNGPIAIQFSGGRTSGYMLNKILEAYDGKLPPDCHVLFQNTGREMPETLLFVEECAERWNVKIVWLEYDIDEQGRNTFRIVGPGTNNPASRNGEPFEKLISKKGFVPNRMARFCTAELKVRVSRDYMRWLGYDKWTAIIGIRADEPKRINDKKVRDRWDIYYPLYCACVSKHDVSDFWRNQDFDLGLLNVKGATPLGNCDGCFLKSEKKRAALCRQYPDRAAWWRDQEKRLQSTFSRDISWQDFMDFVDRQPDFAFDDTNDHFCDADLGACTG